jgi:hypothetical protein
VLEFVEATKRFGALAALDASTFAARRRHANRWGADDEGVAPGFRRAGVSKNHGRPDRSASAVRVTMAV